jgi:hypothetical protein
MFVEELKLETLDEYNYHDTLSPSYSNNTAIFQFILLVGLKQNQKIFTQYDFFHLIRLSLEAK